MKVRALLPFSLYLSLGAALVTVGSVAVQAQTQATIIFYQFKPQVISSNRTDPLYLEAKVSGSPTSVIFELNTNPSQPGTDLPMRDDGTGGDNQAGDGIYTVTLQANSILGALTPEWVFRPFVGFIKLFQGDTLLLRANVFAEILTGEIPRLAVTLLAADVQHTDYLVNIHDPDFFTTFDHSRVTKKFYEFFPDDYDFLDIIYTPSYLQNRFHSKVKNDVLGIGVPVFDTSATYGSLGKLAGITIFPIPGFFDTAESGHHHELGHQWINYLKVPPLDSGIPHWPLSSLASGIMGWSDPVNGQGLNYPCLLIPEPDGILLVPRVGAAVFADLDLYLMGVLPPEEVGEHIVFADQLAAQTLPCNGQLFTGSVIRVSLADIINAVGPRAPSFPNAPSRFRSATIIVSKDGLLDDDAMAFYSFFARRAEETQEVPFASGFVQGTTKPFSIATAGKAALNSALFIRNPVPALSALAPNQAAAGGPDFTLALTGSDFLSGSLVLWNGAARTSTLVSSTEIRAAIRASDLVQGGRAAVTVFTSGGGTSNPLTFTVTDFAVSVSPTSATVSAGQSATYTVTVSPQFGTFDTSISLACSNLPAATSCSFSPSSLTPGANPATSTLTITTNAGARGPGSSLPAPPFGPKLALSSYILWLGLSGLVLFGLARRRRSACFVFRPAPSILRVALLLAFLGLHVTCGGGNSPPPPCTFSISSASQSFSSTGGTGSVQVTASAAGCGWTAATDASWITITSGSSGSGSSTVNFSVAANPNTTSRSGTLTIAGRTFSVTQAAAGTPTGTFTFTIAATSGSLQRSTAATLIVQ